jgi:hypothetical protein
LNLHDSGALAPLRELVQPSAAESEYDALHSRILECVDASDRARCALTLLLQSSESAGGYLFGVRGEQPMLLAALPDLPIEPGLSHWVEDCVRSASGTAEAVTVENAEATRSQSSLCYTDSEGRRLEPIFLLGPAAMDRRVVAVLGVQLSRGHRLLASRRVLDDLAMELLAYGDVGCEGSGPTAVVLYTGTDMAYVPRLRIFARAIGVLARLGVAAAVLAGASQAGHTYVFCRAMQAVMPHACCPTRAGVAPETEAPALAAVASDCCQAKSAATLGSWTPTARSSELAAPALVAMALPSPRDPFVTSRTADLPRHSAAMRTGPPKLRMHVRLMVFQV